MKKSDFFNKSNTLFINFFSLFALSSFLLFIGCEQQIIQSPQEEVSTSPLSFEGIEIVDGMLAIPNQETYNKLYDFYVKNQHAPSVWESFLTPFKQQGFVSLNDAFNELAANDFEAIIAKNGNIEGYENILTIVEDNNGELEAVRQVPESLGSRIVNSQGLLKIDQTVIRYFRNYKLSSVNPTKKQIESLKEVKEGFIPDFCKKEEIYRQIIPIEREGSLSRSVNCQINQIQETEYASSPKRRIKSEMHVTHTTVNPGIDVIVTFSQQVKNQRRNLGIWWAREAKEIKTNISWSSINQSDWVQGPWTSSIYREKTVTNDNRLDLDFALIYRPDPTPYDPRDDEYWEAPDVTFNFTGSNSLTDKDGKKKGSNTNYWRCN